MPVRNCSDINFESANFYLKNAKSLKISPKTKSPVVLETQGTVRGSNNAVNHIYLYKKSSTPDIVTDSTMSSKKLLKRNIGQERNPERQSVSNKRGFVIKSPARALIKPKSTVYKKVRSDHSDEINSEYFSGIQFNYRVKNKTNYGKLEYWLEGCRNSVNCIAGEDGVLFTGDAAGEVRKWNLPQVSDNEYFARSYSKGAVFSNSVVLYKHKKPVTCVEKNSGFMMTGSSDGEARFLKTDGVKKKFNLKPSLKVLKSLNSEKLYSGGSFLEFIDLGKLSFFRNPIEYSSVLVSSNHTIHTFLTGNEDSSVSLWDVRTPRFVNSFKGHKGPVTGLAMSSGFTFFTCSEDCRMKEWDMRTSIEIYSRESEYELKGVLVKDNYVITGGKYLTIWTPDSKEKVCFQEGSVKCIYISAFNNFLYSSGYEASISSMSFNY